MISLLTGTLTDMTDRDREKESPAERLDRNWLELIQEIRVAQSGTQILFAFLLGIAFTQPFRQADQFTHRVYAITVGLAGASTALLIAPAATHRFLFRQKLRGPLVTYSSRVAGVGLFLLMLATAGGLLLALDSVEPRNRSIELTALLLLWFVVFWYVIPAFMRAHARRTPR